MKYSPDRRGIRVSVESHRAGIAIVVRDAGIGIPHREQKEIFRRFVRGEKADRLGIKGTGLGLAMVSHIAQAHGGAVEVESEEGVGRTFRLVLPTLPAAGYPKVAAYKGTGDTNDAANFVCRDPNATGGL